MFTQRGMRRGLLGKNSGMVLSRGSCGVRCSCKGIKSDWHDILSGYIAVLSLKDLKALEQINSKQHFNTFHYLT